MGVWEQIHDSRQIYFKEEDTYDERQEPDMDDDHDLMVHTRNKKFDKGFGYASYNSHSTKAPPPREDFELNNILESRNQQMKMDLQQARLQINRNQVKPVKVEDDIEKENDDEDLAATLKFKKEGPQTKVTRQYELKPLDGDDDFDGMEAGPIKKEVPPIPINRPPPIPNAKNRVKLQPMNINPIL